MAFDTIKSHKKAGFHSFSKKDILWKNRKPQGEEEDSGW